MRCKDATWSSGCSDLVLNFGTGNNKIATCFEHYFVTKFQAQTRLRYSNSVISLQAAVTSPLEVGSENLKHGVCTMFIVATKFGSAQVQTCQQDHIRSGKVAVTLVRDPATYLLHQI
jgi:hypothetical protein